MPERYGINVGKVENTPPNAIRFDLSCHKRVLTTTLGIACPVNERFHSAAQQQPKCGASSVRPNWEVMGRAVEHRPIAHPYLGRGPEWMGCGVFQPCRAGDSSLYSSTIGLSPSASDTYTMLTARTRLVSDQMRDRVRCARQTTCFFMALMACKSLELEQDIRVPTQANGRPGLKLAAATEHRRRTHVYTFHV
jgi:hypothetical protein